MSQYSLPPSPEEVDAFEADPSPGKAGGRRQYRRQPGRTGSFAHGFLDLQKKRDCRLDLAFANHHHVIDQGLRMTRRDDARHSDGDTLGDR